MVYSKAFDIFVKSSDNNLDKSETPKELAKHQDLNKLTRETANQVSVLIEKNKIQEAKIEALEKRINQLEGISTKILQ